ncbi:MAG: Gfo/Idh/MocA family oxidoreductase [Alphaproteobacteria bacterium]|nr:Gfo/Idh/MocA family oxidoreductase [Alphaproteobacteria bacterium]
MTKPPRALVVGLGIQGRKRLAVAGRAGIGACDPVNPAAKWKRIEDVPLGSYDVALVCTPDEAKIELLTYLLSNGKHVLVEKPLFAPSDAALKRLAAMAKKKRVTCYTAYNHRFEPHFVRMKETLQSGVLGEPYLARLFYGNGTARDVRNSAWRDKASGVWPDLGSHLLDTMMFWFGQRLGPIRLLAATRSENRAPDHVAVALDGRPWIELGMTLLSWRNHFTCDVFAEKGSAHISSLCKWGPSTFTLRDRKLPSGRPDESAVTLVQPDPTWALEYQHFLGLCRTGAGNIANDIRLNRLIKTIAADIERAKP